MAKKQTLKSLLGVSDDRVEVELNLPKPRLQNTIQRAGAYSTAFVAPPKTNNLQRIADALGKINPIISDYRDAKNLGKEAEITEGEAGVLEFKNFLAGADQETKDKALKDLMSQQDKTRADIDKYFRNEYGLNPLASIRAQKLLGASKEAEFLAYRNKKVQEYQTNNIKTTGKLPTKEDVQSFVYGLSDAFLEEEGIQLTKGSLAHQGFMTSIMEQTGQDIATLETTFADYHKTNVAIPLVSSSIIQGMEKYSDNPKKALEFVTQAWKDTGMFDTEDQAQVLKSAFALIPAENLDEADEFLELLADNIKIGNQSFRDASAVFNAIEDDIEDRFEAFQKDEDIKLRKETDTTIAEYRTNVRTLISSGKGTEAVKFLAEEEENLREEIGERKPTEYENEILNSLFEQRLSISQLEDQIHLDIEKRSGLGINRTNGLMGRGATQGKSNFDKQHPELATIIAGLDINQPSFSYNFNSGEMELELEGFHTMQPAVQAWLTAKDNALNTVLQEGIIDPQLQGKRFGELMVEHDKAFVADLEQASYNYYYGLATQTRLEQNQQAATSNKELMEATAETLFDDKGQITGKALGEIRKVYNEANIGFFNQTQELDQNEAQTFYTYGMAINGLPDGDEKNTKQAQWNKTHAQIIQNSRAKRQSLIDQANKIALPPIQQDFGFRGGSGRAVVGERDAIRIQENSVARQNNFMSSKSQEFADALRFETFTQDETLNLLRTGNASGNITKELYHSSGFRLPPNFFSPQNFVQISGLDANSKTTQEIARLMNMKVEDLIANQKDIAEMRDQ